MKIYLPKNVKYIIDKIYENGHEAFIVGGCVRDSIIGKIPDDYDITTSAKPEEIINIFSEFKVIKTGIKHGTVSILIDKNLYEVTTYRIEGEYKDFRRPEKVEFTTNLIEDLKRRDFTINAMAYNEKVGLIDIFNGREDLDNKIIKTVGSADKRFNEDGLRIIRAIRFSSKLNFKIEKDTLQSIYKNAHILKNISKERITEEFNKILLSDNSQNILYLYESEIFKSVGICGNLSKEELDILNINLKTLNKCDENLIKRLSLLEFIIKKCNVGSKSIAKSLIYSNKVVADCQIISQYIDLNLDNLDNISIKNILNKIGVELFLISLNLRRLFDNNIYTDNKINIIINKVDTIEKNKECYNIKELNVNGNDLINMGIKGKEVGEKLNFLLQKVIENPKLNQKEILIDLLS